MRFLFSLLTLFAFALVADAQTITSSTATTTTTQTQQQQLLPQVVQQPSFLLPSVSPMLGNYGTGGCGVGANFSPFVNYHTFNGVRVNGNHFIGYGGLNSGLVGRGVGFRGVGVGTPFVGGGFNSVVVQNRGLLGRRTVIRVR